MEGLEAAAGSERLAYSSQRIASDASRAVCEPLSLAACLGASARRSISAGVSAIPQRYCTPAVYGKRIPDYLVTHQRCAYSGDMAEPIRRVAEDEKKSRCVHVRLTRLEAAAVERQAAAHDPPTLAGWLRHVIAGELERKKN